MIRLLFFIVLIVAFGRCTDTKEYTGLTGVWQVEEIGDLTPFRRYNVSIRQHEFLDSVYVVNNFSRAGDLTETYIEYANYRITILGQQVGTLYIFDGQGDVQPDFKLITLTYKVNNNLTGRQETFTANLRRN